MKSRTNATARRSETARKERRKEEKHTARVEQATGRYLVCRFSRNNSLVNTFSSNEPDAFTATLPEPIYLPMNTSNWQLFHESWILTILFFWHNVNSNVLFLKLKIQRLEFKRIKFQTKDQTERKKNWKRIFKVLCTLRFFRCFEVQSEWEINSSGNGQCVVCYFFYFVLPFW